MTVRKTTLYISDQIDARLRRAARRLGRSRAQLTREALAEFLERNEREPGLPPSVGMGSNPDVRAADDEARLARAWRRRR